MATMAVEAEMKWVAWSQLVLAMVVVQVFSTGLQLLSRVILTNGTFVFALTTYRFVVATLCVAPLALYFERGDVMKLKTFTIWLWLFLNSTIIEELRLASNASKAKTTGVFLCVEGAFITTLYKGKAFHFYISQHITHYPFAMPIGVKTNWIHGTLFLIGSCFCYATFYLMQVKVKEVSLSKYWTTMITCTIASAQSTVVGDASYYNNVLLTYMGNFKTRTELSPYVQSLGVGFCSDIRGPPSRSRDPS
ncbi:hypothetical protein SLEP1_g34908 [Rubroshorea leprosula]|uniref:WAT1-related protein n=1 Tax=Rubroshorea leprosula TaxID=152421 RepID=A0AAV5KLG8_9ROSI|nr:hypothetical protein SLEP1_g34908 [Rubroshorea leprosula]